MVLNHVAHDARLLIVAAAPLDAHRFGVRDLDVVNVLPVPKRLVDAVGEAEDQKVLDGLFAEVVVNAVNLRLVEVAEDLLVQLARAVEARAKGLLDDDANPALVLFGQARLAQLSDRLGVELRRDREVEEAVPLCAVLLVNLFEQLGEFAVAFGLVNVRRQELHPPGERLPHLLVNALGLRELDDRSLHLVAELLVRHRRAAQADDGELGGQQVLLHETVERRDELPLGEVARRAEDDDRARLSRPLKTHPRPHRVLNDYRCLHLQPSREMMNVE